MASSVYVQHYYNGTSRTVRRSARQGRKPGGFGRARLVRPYQEDEAKLEKLAEKFGYCWNENQFIRDAIRDKLRNSVYAELLNT